MLGGEVAAAVAAIVIVVVAFFFTTAVRKAADVATNATQATRAVGMVRTVHAADFGVAAVVAAVVVALVVVVIAPRERHLVVDPGVERTLVVRPEPRLVVHCPESAGRGRQGERR